MLCIGLVKVLAVKISGDSLSCASSQTQINNAGAIPYVVLRDIDVCSDWDNACSVSKPLHMPLSRWHPARQPCPNEPQTHVDYQVWKAHHQLASPPTQISVKPHDLKSSTELLHFFARLLAICLRTFRGDMVLRPARGTLYET
eukprot:5454278-Amphidinium_carterae.1